jgi:hypothetical protein
VCPVGADAAAGERQAAPAPGLRGLLGPSPSPMRPHTLEGPVARLSDTERILGGVPGGASGLLGEVSETRQALQAHRGPLEPAMVAAFNASYD